MYETIEVSRKVKSKILKSLILSGLIPMILLMIVAYYFSLQKTREVLMTELKTTADRAASLTRTWKIRHESNLEWLTIQLGKKEFTRSQKTEILKGLTESNSDIAFAVVINLKGDAIARSDGQPLINYADRAYFKKAVSGEVNTEAVLARIYREPVLCTVGPRFRNKVVAEVVMLCGFIKVLANEIGYMKVGNTGYVILVDQNNQKLLHPESDDIQILHAGPETEALQASREGITGEYSFKASDKQNYLSYLFPISSGWTVIGLQRESEIINSAIKALAAPTLICLLLLGLSVGLTYLSIARTTRPLQDLSYSLKQKVTQQSQQLIYSAKMSSLGEMASGIAHEINNPLAIISLITQNLRQKFKSTNEDPEIIEQLNKIDNTCNRITKIVKGLKTFSRNGSQDPMYRENLSTILDETYSLCAESLRNRGITLKVDCPPELELECQPIQLSQVFVNLIMNSKDAIHELPQKWIEIVATKANDKIFVQFTDSGFGISQADQDKIMQPFYTTKKIGEGTGLGLSISKGIVEFHHGKLWYNPDSPHTQFCLVLPISQMTAKQSIGKSESSIIM